MPLLVAIIVVGMGVVRLRIANGVVESGKPVKASDAQVDVHLIYMPILVAEASPTPGFLEIRIEI